MQAAALTGVLAWAEAPKTDIADDRALLSANAKPHKTYTILGLLPNGDYLLPGAINEKGQIVGTSYSNGSGAARAFLWQDGEVTDLGPGYAVGINNEGDVVGQTLIGNDAFAFIWRKGKLTNLGALGGKSSYGSAINNEGQVAGTVTTASGVGRAFLWEKGKLTLLDNPNIESSYASGINDKGVVVGQAKTFTGGYYGTAFVWQNGQMTDLGKIFGSQGSRGSTATGINNNGQVIGTAFTQVNNFDPGEAFLWEDGQITDLGAFVPNSLNDKGQIAGMGQGHVSTAAVLWRDKQLILLQDLLPPNSGWELESADGPYSGCSAHGINNRGQILGVGYHNGVKTGFVLTPDRDREDQEEDE